MNNISFWLRLDNLFIAICCLLAYEHVNGSWWLFAALFLAPDLFMLGYLIDNRRGAWVYNLVHHYAGPLALGLGGSYWANPLVLQLALIWLSHISLDRVMGFGLKYNDAFQHTHLEVNQAD